jgi:YD repeat-containing protein
MAITKTFNLNQMVYQATPFIWGSLLDVSSLTIADKAAPFLVVQDLPGFNYVMDTRGRLTNVNLTNGQSVIYNLDDSGNRTSVVTA